MAPQRSLPFRTLTASTRIISRDPGITAKVLQVANSVACGLPGRINDVGEAIQQLGMTTVRSLALSAQVYGNFAPGRLKSFSAEVLWAHLMECGELARVILRREHAEIAEAEDAFTAGMLHDMGKLISVKHAPER
jgi:HD-like signal output (HDOD) protein